MLVSVEVVAAGEAQDPLEMFRVYEAPPAADRVLEEDEIRASAVVKERQLVHRDGDWHRSVEVWVYDEKGRFVVQRRSALKDTNPGMLDTSCAGHVTLDDSIEETAVRELREELGCRASASDLVRGFVAPIEAAGDREIVTVFFLRVVDTHFVIDPAEVASLSLLPSATVLDDLRAKAPAYVAKPPHYVDALSDAFHRLIPAQ
ncbi:hypothetical protein CTAYLR_008251 [Chrysophaeum taylorii]|uniref:Nudix hydrolase domain-containing protein n=1 Tax=Chrysophaeum taylorii TaxID=2483200 RepID=A0AAD7UKW5_9STRA|nr:hypothetical protein CTAYLR_008251 [Chrysophaeum taylorii]